MRQAQQDIAGVAGAGAGGRLQDAFHLGVVQPGDHRRGQYRHRHPGARQCLDGLQAACGRGGARLHHPGQRHIQRGDGQMHPHQIVAGQRLQNIEVAQHAGRFRHDADRVIEPVQHRQHRAGELQRALDRLVRVGVGAQRQGARHVARLAQFLLQQLRHVRLEGQPGFEIEAGRIPEIGVRRPGIAVDAAMLAAAIGVHRAIEADVGRLVPGDDAAAGIARQRGGQRRQGGEFGAQCGPAVIERSGFLPFEAVGRVHGGAATTAQGRGNRFGGHWRDGGHATQAAGAAGAGHRVRRAGSVKRCHFGRVQFPRQIGYVRTRILSHVDVPFLFKDNLRQPHLPVKNENGTWTFLSSSPR